MLEIRNTAIGALCLLLAACGGDGGNSSIGEAKLSPAAELGRLIFFDTSLSSSGKLACASCHVPSRAHAGNDNLAAPLGGMLGTTMGFRNAPSLNYLGTNPAFFFDSEGTPTGGFDRDGRASDFASQSERPFLSAHEMDNVDAAGVAAKLARASYASQFQSLFGADVFRDPATAFARAQLAISQYEKEDPSFQPYNSKYDAFLAGRAQLTAQELRGLALFNSPVKGNCAACHTSARADGASPLFTDFTYDNLGVPRNMLISANNDASYYDLGLCGPMRTDLADRADLCGAFKVPSLRNVAITGPYFHNGQFDTVKKVIEFYVRRDTNPEEWYPRQADGTILKFDDLPAAYRRNVNMTEAPYNRTIGDAPALNDAEIDDLVAFLGTLTDGYGN